MRKNKKGYSWLTVYMSACHGIRGVTMGEEGGHNPRGKNFYGAAESLREAPKIRNIVTCTFFITVHLLPKNLKFEHGGAKLASCPGRHLTSLRPCIEFRFDAMLCFNLSNRSSDAGHIKCSRARHLASGPQVPDS